MSDSDGANIEIIAGVPVHYRGEYELNVESDYERIYKKNSHDSEHADGLGGDPGTTTALYAVGSARYLAERTETLAEVLHEPYTLRTTRDAETLVTALGRHVEALAKVAEGVGVWLDGAHQRGELDEEPAAARTHLAETAQLLRAAGVPLGAVAVPGDRSPALDMNTLIAGVIEQLRARGVNVTKVTVFDSETVWDLEEGRILTLSGENSWDLGLPNGQESSWTPVYFGVSCWYAHPDQIAGLVADALAVAKA